LAAVWLPHPAAADDAQMGEPALLQSLLPTVVNITAVAPGTPEQASGTAEVGHVSSAEKPHFITGSGFIIDPAGLIVTNLHVVDHAYKITVIFSDQSRYPAHMLSASRVTDIALLEVQVDHKLPAARWGDSDKLIVGDPVIAIGNPLGIGESVTSGIVSGLNRNIMETPYDEFIQTDAAINHGNSGGPLFDMKGEVVGINTAIVSPTAGSAGLGFAIPASDASFIVDQLRKFGALHPGWLGLKVQQVTPDMAQALGMSQPRGSIIAIVTPHGPAEQAGLQVGDVVTSIDDKPVSDERALLRAIAKSAAGQVLKIGGLRAGQDVSFTATISHWPREQWDALDAVTPTKPPPISVPPDLGLTLAPLNDETRTKFGLVMPQAGVVVTGVAPGTDAAQRGIVPGDVVLQVGNKKVTDAGEMGTLLQAAAAAKTPFLMLLVVPKAQAKRGPEWIALRASV
jgi:serine protease Do